jgi:hypothetical protein
VRRGDVSVVAELLVRGEAQSLCSRDVA